MSILDEYKYSVVQLMQMQIEQDMLDNMILFQSELPASPYYVTCRDNFMSDWGPTAGRGNVLIFLCQNADEAKLVDSNLRHERSDMDNIQIRIGSYTLREISESSPVYQVMTQDNFPSAYKPIPMWNGYKGKTDIAKALRKVVQSGSVTQSHLDGALALANDWWNGGAIDRDELSIVLRSEADDQGRYNGKYYLTNPLGTWSRWIGDSALDAVVSVLGIVGK